MAKDEKTKAFEAAIKKLKKKHPDSIWYKEKTSYAPSVERTWLPSIDYALRTGGIPKRRIIELFGQEASGKTTLCLHIISQVQKHGGTVVYLDAEHSLDPDWARKLGVDMDRMPIIQQENGPMALDAVRELIQDGHCDMFVVDSVAALVTKEELEGEMGDRHVGVQARLMSNLMKVINVDLLKTDTIAMFTNQMREKIGVKYGNPATTTGGKALKFYASVRIEVSKTSDDDAYKKEQHHAKVRIAKNKLAPPFGVGYFRIDPKVGILKSYSIAEPAVELEVVKHESGGKTYEYNGKSWTGMSRFLNALEGDENLQREISEAIYAKMAENTVSMPTPSVIIDEELPENQDNEEVIDDMEE